MVEINTKVAILEGELAKREAQIKVLKAIFNLKDKLEDYKKPNFNEIKLYATTIFGWDEPEIIGGCENIGGGV